MSISVNVTPGGGSGLSSGAKVSVVTGQGLGATGPNGMADHGFVVADKSTTGDPRDGVAGVKLSRDVRWQELSDLG